MTYLIIWHDGEGSTVEAANPRHVFSAGSREDATQIENAVSDAIEAESLVDRYSDGWVSTIEISDAGLSVAETRVLITRFGERTKDGRPRYEIESLDRYEADSFTLVPDPLPGGETWVVHDNTVEDDDSRQVFAGFTEGDCQRFIARRDA